jgi:hypothetical protein
MWASQLPVNTTYGVPKSSRKVARNMGMPEDPGDSRDLDRRAVLVLPEVHRHPLLGEVRQECLPQASNLRCTEYILHDDITIAL